MHIVKPAIALLFSTALTVPQLAAQETKTDPARVETGSRDDTGTGNETGNRAAQDAVIVVSGFRLSEQKSIQTKRDAFNIVDAISADDIGRLPDQNTAAALRRLPGVSVQEDQGEPRFPVIRGLPSTYNRTQINGSIIASVDNGGRTVPLDIVPSTLASSLEVYKTITPDLDPNAVGGLINIVTKSAFSEDGFFFDATGALTDYELSGDVRGERLSWRANGTTGTRFGPDGQFGIVASASYQIRDSDIPQVETANPSYREYTAAGAPVNLGDPAGNGRIVPVQRRLFLYNNIRERYGAALAFEWQADPNLYLRLFGSYNRMEDDEQRHENRLQQSGNVSNQGLLNGRFDTARNIVGLGRFQINRTIWNSQFNLKWEPSSAIKIDFDALYSGAELDNPESTETFQTANSTQFGFNYNVTDFFFDFRPINPSALANPANYAFSNRGELQRTSQEDVYEARTAITHSSDFDDGEVVIKAGGLYRQTDRNNDQDFTSFTLPAGSPLNYTLANAFGRRPVDIVGGYQFDLIVDSDAANNFFAANRSNFNASPNNLVADFTVREKVYGGFAQVSGTFGDLQATGGIRYERTDIDSGAVRIVNGVISPANATGGYDSFLPSLHLRWNAAPDVVLRAAYTNTIGRPDFADITAREAISFSNGGLPSLSRGNPDLRPRRSEGLDASVEYYTASGLLALGVFYKSIEDEIFTITDIETRDLGLGTGPELVEVSQSRNAQSASIFGIEAAIQQSFTFLPAPFDGLGINLNGTYIDSNLEVLTATGPRQRGFFLQPEWTANASLFYEKGPFQSRLAYNYLGGFLENINGTIPEADQFWEERGQLDAQIRLRLAKQLEIFAEGENLTNAGRRELTGPNRNLLQEAAEYGRTFTLGASVSF